MMRTINLSLEQEMISRILQGYKISHSTPYPLGNPGDWFAIGGRVFRIVEVYDLDLYSVIQELFRFEGFETPEDLSISWLKRNPGVYDGSEIVYVHFFGMVVNP